MKSIRKILNKENLPIALCLIFIFRFLPSIIVNAFSKEPVELSSGIPGKTVLVAELFLLVVIYFYNFKSIKLNKKSIITLLIIVSIMCVSQIKNSMFHTFRIKDIVNIAILGINIVLFYIVLYDFKIEEKSLVKFLKGIMFFSIIAIIWNLILFNKEILAEFGIVIENYDYTYLDNPKGFLGNRNTLAFVIYLSIICDVILMNLDNPKNRYKILLCVFWFGIWCTHSKTGYIATVLFIGGYTFFNDSYNFKKKIIMCVCIGILSILGFSNIMGYLPIKHSPKVDKVLVMSSERVKRVSGRTDIWKRGIDTLNVSPFNYFFGVGKDNALKQIEDVNGKKFEVFHNLYLELILIGGIVELIYIFFVFGTIIKKIIKSDLKVVYKKIYIIMYITYSFYIMFESMGKFLTSPTDAACLIMFIAIPLLHTNSIKIEDKKEEINE